MHTLEIEVNSALKNISHWLISNKLTLNVDKSNLLFFNVSNIQKTDLDIRLGNEKLEVKQYAKYLGLHIDSKLTWEKQILITNSKLHKEIDIIRTMWHFLQEKQLELLFSAFISPYLDYGALAWGGAAKTHINKLERSLRKIMRLMMFKDKKHIAKPLYGYLKVLPLELNIKPLQAKFVKKLILKEHPKIICEKYPLNYNSSINNSDQTKLIVPYFRTNLGTCSLAFKGYDRPLSRSSLFCGALLV